MAAYGAVISLKNTIFQIVQSSRILLLPPQILTPAYDALFSLQLVLLGLESTDYGKIRTKVNALDERIKEAIWEFEDLLESHLVDQILPQQESERDHMSFSVDLQSLQRTVDCFVEMVTGMEAEYGVELLNMPEEEGQLISSRIDFGGVNSKMVGLSGYFEQTRDHLLAENTGWSSVIGMAGVGKTTLAKKVFDDPLIQSHFELRAWVKVGRKWESNEILRCILDQVAPITRDLMLTQKGEEILVELLRERLKHKKCLIVFDDVWDAQVMDNLPEENVRILLTSRIRLGRENYPYIKVRLLDEEESKKLLGEKVFGEEGFPPHLEKLGEKIAKKCEGLPLLIIRVAELLSKEEKTSEYWTEVAEKQHNSVFVDAYNQISEVLYPSYEYLPQYLKMVFLYLGAFPPYRDIVVSNIFHLLKAEGFLETVGDNTLHDFIGVCMGELISHYHLVLFKLKQESWFSTNEFRVHSCWQHVCKKEASKIKFLHVLQSWDDVMKNKRRLCVHCNTLFAFKKVYDSIKNECASTARSLLCLGPDHQYSVPIHAMDFKLLNVLDALKIRFYYIPLEIMKLVCLKYLALTCNKELPTSISNLFQLQFLIIYPYINIKRRGAQSCMPVKIWDMQELQHIEVMGRDLPTPNSNATLAKLSGLVGVSAKSFTREILKRVPNLKTLRIHVELKPYDDDEDSDSLSGLGYISEELLNLESLMYYVLNPEMKYESVVPLSMFSTSVTKLELSGLGCPWKHMNDIGSLLPNLRILYLQHYAFRGPEWDIELGSYLKLETLVIEDTDLVRWRPQQGSLPMLSFLSIRHCYKLQQLDWARDPSTVKTKIELVECNPLAVTSSEQLRMESLIKVRCYSSF